MKKWNAPEIAELNITETANGLFDSNYETVIILNDSKKPVKPDDGNGNSINNGNDVNALS